MISWQRCVERPAHPEIFLLLTSNRESTLFQASYIRNRQRRHWLWRFLLNCPKRSLPGPIVECRSAAPGKRVALISPLRLLEPQRHKGHKEEFKILCVF